jgi:excisionase family DNA binding protein
MGEAPDRLRTAEEIAELLAVPISWVREHTRSGAIPHVELGRYKRYRLEDVLAWLDELAGGRGPRMRRYHPAPRTRRAGDAATSRPPAPKE